MKKPTAFEKMRKQRANLLRWASNKQMREFDELQEKWRKEELAYDLAEIDRKSKEDLDRIMFDVGMSMWGCDLTACLFNPEPLKVPAPPVYGGERYKMMEIPRPKVKA